MRRLDSSAEILEKPGISTISPLTRISGGLPMTMWMSLAPACTADFRTSTSSIRLLLASWLPAFAGPEIRGAVEPELDAHVHGPRGVHARDRPGVRTAQRRAGLLGAREVPDAVVHQSARARRRARRRQDVDALRS